MDDKTRKKIVDHYQRGQGSIQDIARVYRLSVSEVLEILEKKNLENVYFIGDTIDQGEAGPGANMNFGQVENINFSTD